MAKKVRVKEVLNDKIDYEPKINKKSPIILFIIIFILGICICLIFYLLYSNNKEELKSSNKKIEELNDKIDKLNSQLKSTDEELESVHNSLFLILQGKYDVSYIKEKLDFIDENVVFWIEGFGDKYWTYDCMQKKIQELDGDTYSFRAYNERAAIIEGLMNGVC